MMAGPTMRRSIVRLLPCTTPAIQAARFFVTHSPKLVQLSVFRIAPNGEEMEVS